MTAIGQAPDSLWCLVFKLVNYGPRCWGSSAANRFQIWALSLSLSHSGVGDCTERICEDLTYTIYCATRTTLTTQKKKSE